MGLRQEQEKDMLRIIREAGHELHLAGGIVPCMIDSIDDAAQWGENGQTRTRGIIATIYARDIPQHGDTFEHDGWKYIINTIAHRPGSAIAKITAVAQHLI